MAGKITSVGLDLLGEKFIGTSSEGVISQFKVGIGTTAPTDGDTNLEIAIPIDDGTVNDDGNNQMTGSSGGTNTTDNTTTFKQGGGVTDVTAQNLIANGTNATKIWTISNLASNGTNVTQTQFFSIWFYIKDSTALAKFKSSGTALEVKLGSTTSDYFSITKTAANLSVGWNLITSNTVAVEDLTETGTVSGNVDTFIIEVTTNNASDTFSAGDVIYDLLRTWVATDLVKNFETSFPTYTSATKQVQSRMILTSSEANGYDISEISISNTELTAWSRDVLTSSFSKSNTEELRFTQKDRFENKT